MQTTEIRSRFLNYFAKQGHTIVESSSLVPGNDPTLLFTNAGMVQFKDVFLGKDKRSYTRATTSQKCVRAGGKHNDLENVGFTARHHTFFEMLGNFSFGDYFKKEAIHYAWQFVTEELKLPKERLYVTVFEKDDEAAQIWHEQEKIPLDRIYRFGEKDNFWSMGDTGPCGPCSEIFIDRGEKAGCGRPTCKMGCDCDRYMEFWNLVFMQYDRSADGKLTPLPRPSVDTGAGLERIASILQEVATNYDTDAFQNIIKRIAELAHTDYAPALESAFSFRVIADHSRAAAFLVGDGVMPSNEGRGYVLRRIIRRAVRHGKKLGFTGPFIHKTAGFVIDQMKEAYPDLIEKRAFIEKAILAEEEQFFKTLERGLSLLDEETAKIAKGNALPGDVAFKLYDTFGFPLDLTRVICTEKGLNVDEAGFETCMEKQRAESRKHWKGSGEEALEAIYLEVANELKAEKRTPKFSGYTLTEETSPCWVILKKEGNSLKKVTEATGDCIAIFESTPFYGESGGQMGDQGVLTANGFHALVTQSAKPVADFIALHLTVQQGVLSVGKNYTQKIDTTRRALISRNHTATHLLHWALRDTLGKHVKQSGSLVTHELLRFDFSHFQAVSEEELRTIEAKINSNITSPSVETTHVLKREMGKDEAVAAGAIAFFGEKYGEKVRVVSCGDYSTELCGGTHVDRTNDLGLFKIVSEGGIAAGVRRIIAVTSEGVGEYIKTNDQALKTLREKLKATSVDEALQRVEKLVESEKDLKKQLEQLQAKASAGEADALIAAAISLPQGARLIVNVLTPAPQAMKKLREMCDTFKQKASDAIVVLGMQDTESGTAHLVTLVCSKATGIAKANELINKLSPLVNGRGGGKTDMAQAGGPHTEGLKQLVDSTKQLFL